MDNQQQLFNRVSLAGIGIVVRWISLWYFSLYRFQKYLSPPYPSLYCLMNRSVCEHDSFSCRYPWIICIRLWSTYVIIGLRRFVQIYNFRKFTIFISEKLDNIRLSELRVSSYYVQLEFIQFTLLYFEDQGLHPRLQSHELPQSSNNILSVTFLGH